MHRRSLPVLAFTMGYKQGTGTWDEDFVNDYNAQTYRTPRSTLEWYAKMERNQTLRSMRFRQTQQSDHNNEGRHHSGKGAFERELERRGVQVDKYPLTTTTGAKRVAELVLLRRLELEKRAAALLEEEAKKRRRDSPSDWFDETDGPLNPRFVERMQSHYSTPITPLPDLPILREREGIEEGRGAHGAQTEG